MAVTTEASLAGAASGAPLLQAQGLVYRYPGAAADSLNGLDLAVHRRRRLALLGANGAGKTTLLLHLNGTLQPREGQVLLAGNPASYRRPALLSWRQRVGLVLQDADDHLFAATVGEDISFGPLNLGLTEDEARQRVDEAMEALQLHALAGRPPHLLSHGQRKRVAIAGLLAMRPEILILDEPTAGLDHEGQQDMLAALEVLEERGTTLVLSTHDVDLACLWADEVALFAGGRTLAQGDAASVLANPALVAAAGIRLPAVTVLQQAAASAGLTLPASLRSVEDWARAMVEKLAPLAGSHACPG